MFYIYSKKGWYRHSPTKTGIVLDVKDSLRMAIRAAKDGAA